MTALTLDPVTAVLLVHGVTDGWTTIDPKCPNCDGSKIHGGPGGWYDAPGKGKPCGPCGGSGRNPLLDVAGRPCPTCNGLKRFPPKVDPVQEVASGGRQQLGEWTDCPSCLGSGGWTVEIWTNTAGKDEAQDYGPWVLWPRTNGTFWLERRDGKISYTWEVPLGVQVGTCTLSTALPIVGNCQPLPEGHENGFLYLRGVAPKTEELWLIGKDHDHQPGRDISHLLPYADWTPGRWAVRLTNLTPKDPT